MKIKRKSTKDFPFVRRNLLRLVHKLQVKALKMKNINLYYLLASIHFKLWFKMTLKNCIIDNRPEAKLAMRRHARLVLKYVFETSDSKVLAKAAMKTFRNNYLLEAEL